MNLNDVYRSRRIMENHSAKGPHRSCSLAEKSLCGCNCSVCLDAKMSAWAKAHPKTTN